MKKNLYQCPDIHRQVIVILLIYMMWNSSAPCLPSVSSSVGNDENQLYLITKKISENLPEGFKLRVQPRFYGTPDAKLENGTIFDYIDGAGENYIRHGFTSVAHIVLENSAGDRITVDVYDLSSNRNAQDAFEDENICAPRSSPLDPGIPLQAKVYSYTPDYMLYFVENRFLIHINLDNDAFKDKAEVLSAQIVKIINEE
jgi:hypothetical protein